MVGPVLALQPFNHPNFPWSFGYIRKLAFESPWGNYFTPGLVCRQYTAHMNIKLAQTPPSQGTNSHLGRVEWSLGYSFLEPREIHVRPVQDSNQEPLDNQWNVLPTRRDKHLVLTEHKESYDGNIFECMYNRNL